MGANDAGDRDTDEALMLRWLAGDADAFDRIYQRHQGGVFRYRIEIYTPQPKRIYGYYVLPFLEGDRLTARFCLKADRQAGLLRVNASHGEDEVDAVRTAEAAAPELRRMAAWLGLADVEAAQRGALAKPLRQALKLS